VGSDEDAKVTAFDWPTSYPEAVGLRPDDARAAFSKGLTLTTGCSGAGTPAHVLQRMLGDEGFTELLASDSDKRMRNFCRTHYSPQHMFIDVAAGVDGTPVHCDVCGEAHVTPDAPDEEVCHVNLGFLVKECLRL